MADTGRSGDPGTTPRDTADQPSERSFATHPTGTALAKDLRDVRSKPERAFNVGAALGLTLAVATFIFLIQNNVATDFEWLWFDFQLPLWTALVGALVTGALLVLTALAVHRRRRRRIGRRDRAAGRLEQALVGSDEPAPAPRGRPDEPNSTDSPGARPTGSPGSAASEPPPPPATPSAEPEITRPTGPRQVRGPMQG